MTFKRFRYLLNYCFTAPGYEGMRGCAPRQYWIVCYPDGLKTYPMGKGNAFDYMENAGGNYIEKVSGFWKGPRVYYVKAEPTE